MDSLPPLRDVVARYGLAPKKSLGQNFLFDLNLTRRIARAAGPLENATIIEVGPGPGGLTRALLMEGAQKIIVVERDERCLEALEDIARACPGRLDIVAADALEVDFTALAQGNVRIAANLPYNIGTALLTRWVASQAWPPFWSSMTLMFQREVAERIVADENDARNYGRLGVLCGWRTRAQILFDVSPAAFTPPPKVLSSLVRLEPVHVPLPCRLEALEAITKAAFGQRRKMLRQSLKASGKPPELLLEMAGLNPTSRAEDLSIKDFAALAKALDEV